MSGWPPSSPSGPVHLPVEAVPEREVGVQPRAVGAGVGVSEVEGVLHVVEVADLQVPVDRVELLRREHHVLHLGATHPFDPDVELAAGQGLGDDAHERPAGQEAGVDLDDDAQHVLAVEEDRPGVGERELPRRDRRQGRAGIHDERVPPHAGEDPHAAPRPALLVVDAEGDLLPDWASRRSRAAHGPAGPRSGPTRAPGRRRRSRGPAPRRPGRTANRARRSPAG